MTNANEILFRCSGLGNIMFESGLTDIQNNLVAELSNKPSRTDKQQAELLRLINKRDNPELTLGCKNYLIDVFVSQMYNRREEITSKFLDKGNERENDSITLLSINTRILYIKNETHLSNSFIKGTPDVFTGKNIHEAEQIKDTKTSWSAHTYFRAINRPLDPMYYWPGVGYMALTGAKMHSVAFCLVNGTITAINDEKRKLLWKYTDETDEEYIEKCKQVEINHIFDLAEFKREYPHFNFDNNLENWNFDIPRENRLFQFTFERNESDIEKLYARVGECRKWMNKELFKL